MEAPVLSLITGKVGRDESFQRLLSSIENNTTVNWELIVSDASEDTYKPERENVRVIAEKPRLGCAAGYNVAFRAARGKFVIWLNDDCEVMPGYDEAAIRFMEANPRIGLGALHYMEGDKPWHVNEAWGCIYANFGIIRKALGDQVGWFGSTVAMYGCDNVLSLEVLLAGYGVADIPASRVIHHSEKDATRVQNQMNRLRDNHALTEKYMPLKSVWLSSFNRHRVGGTVPWSHGVNPNSTARMVKR